MQTSKDVKVKKAVMRIHQVYKLLIKFPSSKQAKHSVPDKGYLVREETELSVGWAASKRGRLLKEGGVPASASSFCSSLLALRGKEEVLSLFSLFTAEWEPGCFALISWVAGGPVLPEPCREKAELRWCQRQSKRRDNHCAQVSARSRGEFGVHGSSSLPNQIEYLLERQPDNSQRCTVLRLLTWFWTDTRGHNNWADGTDGAVNRGKTAGPWQSINHFLQRLYSHLFRSVNGEDRNSCLFWYSRQAG